MQDLARIKSLLASRGLRPNRKLGQNFLHEPVRVARLVASAELEAGDVVLEVGPGTGALTEALLEAGARVVACELDEGLADLIDEEVRPIADGRLELVRGDCLGRGRRLASAARDAIDAAMAAEGRTSFRLVSNLPYQAASPLMAELLLHHPDCHGQFVTIQKEVADRLTAGPGTKAYGTLGIIVQAFGTPRRVDVLPPGCFWPAPKVTSAAVAIHRRSDADRPTPLADPESGEGFARFLNTIFSQRRKQLGSVLGRDREWPEGITPDLRPEAVSVDGLARLWEACGRPVDGI
ncbi:MAG: 16S rRNA (adenine(1518)-N(6)/adenine(1519)-N(6))-dimethyltransferase RsmA [Phycisphaerales bacterium]